MFDNPRYATKGINEEIPIITQVILWGLIDALEIKKDYLQVFNLMVENNCQKIVHTQEQPDYSAEYIYRTNQPITAKIYVIDDETHSTMLLADEY